MAELKYKPVPHDHKAFMERARVRKGFARAEGNLTPNPSLQRTASVAAELQRWLGMLAEARSGFKSQRLLVRSGVFLIAFECGGALRLLDRYRRHKAATSAAHAGVRA